MAALPAKGYTPIKADMIFRHDKFRLPGKRPIYTATSEPTILPVPLIVRIDVTTVTGTHKTLRLPCESMVMKKDK